MDYSGEGDVDNGAVTARRREPRGRPRVDLRMRGGGLRRLHGRGTSRSSSAARCNFATKAAEREPPRAHPLSSSSTRATTCRATTASACCSARSAQLGIAIPVVGTSFEIGETLAHATDPTVDVVLETTTVTVDTFNVLATSKKGDPTKQVVVGAHLDSVRRGSRNQRQRNRLGDAARGRDAAGQVTKSTARQPARFACWGRRGGRPAGLELLRLAADR